MSEIGLIHKGDDFDGVFASYTFYTKIITHCPVTGEYDCAQLDLEYVSRGTFYELVSLRKYVKSFVGKTIYTEDILNEFFNKLVEVHKPYRIKVTYRGIPELENAHDIYTYDNYLLTKEKVFE